MRTLSTILFVLVAIINLAPSVGVASAARLESLYGISIDSPDLMILMRHRAVLLGLIGGLLAVAAFQPSLRNAAVACGLVSMLSFIVVLVIVGGAQAPLVRVAWIDAVASLALAGAWAIDRWLST